MRRTVLLLATMALAIALSCGVALAIKEPAIINGEWNYNGLMDTFSL